MRLENVSVSDRYQVLLQFSGHISSQVGWERLLLRFPSSGDIYSVEMNYIGNLNVLEPTALINVKTVLKLRNNFL